MIKSPFEADTGVRFGLKLPFERFEVGGKDLGFRCMEHGSLTWGFGFKALGFGILGIRFKVQS